MTAAADRPSPLPDEDPDTGGGTPTPPAVEDTPAPAEQVPATNEDPPATAEPTPPTVRPRGDTIALVVAAAIPLVGVALTLAAQTWLTVAFLMLVPAIVVVYALGLVVLIRALRRRSVLRRELGHVPRRYRVYAWLWAIAFLVAAVSPTLGGLDMPWSLQAVLVGASAVVVGIVTGSMWSTYQHDVTWVTASRDD